MRVLSVCTNLPSRGQPQRGLFVARRLSEMAKRAELFALNPEPFFPGIRGAYASGRHVDCGFPIDVRPMFYFPGIAKSLDGWWMTRCVGRWLDSLGSTLYRDAILDAHFGYPEGVGCVWAAQKRGIPVFVTIRGLETDLFLHKRIGTQLVNTLNAANGVIAVSHSLKTAAQNAGVVPERISVIPNGVDASYYTPGDRAAARRSVSFPLDRKLIVCVGTLKPIKGHDVLLQSFARVARDRPIDLVCIGAKSDAGWFKHLEKLAREIGIQSSVQFLGSKPPEEVVRWLRASDLFALASHREGCCNAVIEALSTGTPVIATSAGDNADYVQEGIFGYLSPPSDVERLARNLSLGLNRSWSAQRISSSMLQRSWNSAAESVLSLFRTTLYGQDARQIHAAGVDAFPT